MRSPFALSRRNGVLHMTLDTPGASVNIFDAEAARQVIDVLSSLRPSSTRAVVFESAKPGSFLNGARLMSLCSVREARDGGRMMRDVARAYEAVASAPVPTVAAIRGNCYGCGLEFTLHCRHRLACDTAETHFYLPELCDYLVLPAFGAMRLLSPHIGLANAGEMLLWGERWSAGRAAEGGLVHELLPDEHFEERTDDFVRRLLAGEEIAAARPQRALDRRAWAKAQRARIGALPPLYRPLYEECLDLLLRWDEGKEPAAALRRIEAARVGRSACAPMVRPAVSYFFIRQTAHVVAERTPLHRWIADARLGGDQPLPGTAPVLEDWLAAWLSPMVAFTLRGGDPSAVQSTLREHGFTQDVSTLLQRLEPGPSPRVVIDHLPDRLRTSEVESALSSLASPSARRGRPSPPLADALMLSLLDVALRSTRERLLPHPSCCDVVAREVLAFPLHLGSLCTHLTPSRVASLLARRRRWEELLPSRVVEEAERFAATGREIYR